MPRPPADPSGDVARYYDRNTRRFLLFGRGRAAYSIHRELWGPGVSSAHEAADYVHGLMADEIARVAPDRPLSILDFGCGVGGTLFRLAERFPSASLHGITVSERQIEIARRLAMRLGHGDRCSFTLGDFQAADLDVRADAIIAVESFAHAPNGDAFLANASRHLAVDGRLVVTDDFLAVGEDRLDVRERSLADRLRTGWRIPGLRTVEGLVDAAARHGLEPEKIVDLTAFTRPRSRMRDYLVAALGPVLARLGLSRVPLCGNMIGGHALQIGLSEGFLVYQMVVFRRARAGA